MADDAPLLSVSGISVRRGATQVLEGVDLEVSGGEVVLVTGENGAGKSTLLEAAAGLLSLSAGSVSQGGRKIRDSDGRRQRPRRFGLTLQSGGFCQDELVDERLATAIRVAGHQPDEEWIAERLNEWGLRHRAKDRIAWLSGGLKRRLGVLAGLIPGLASEVPRLILLDEPSEGLDEASVTTLRRQISALAASGHGLIVASHDDDLADLATRTVEVAYGSLSESESEPAESEPLDIAHLPKITKAESEDKLEGQLGYLRAAEPERIWLNQLEQKTRATTIPSLAAGFVALVVVVGMLSLIEPPSNPTWLALLALTPGFLSAMSRPGLLGFLDDSRAGDWWNAQNGEPMQMSNLLFASLVPLFISFLSVGLVVGEFTPASLFAIVGIGVASFGSARIHALESTLPRQGTAFVILLQVALVWPLLLLVDFMTMDAATIAGSDAQIHLLQALAIPLAIWFLVPLIAPE